MADMFKTAYFCRHYRTHENGTADRPDRHPGGNTAQFPTRDAGLPRTSHSHLTSHPFSSDCRGAETSLRPSSAVSASSSSDSAAEVNCSVGEGLGSITSITESVNSWSFRSLIFYLTHTCYFMCHRKLRAVSQYSCAPKIL